MFGLALGALGGICWLQVQRELPLMHAFYAPLVIFGSLVLLLAHPRLHAWSSSSGRSGWYGWCGWSVRAAAACARMGLVAVSAALLATWIAKGELAHRLSETLDQQTFVLDVVVMDLPTRQDMGWRFEVQVREALSIDGGEGGVPSRGVVHWVSHDPSKLPAQIAPGQRWRLPARLRQPTGTLNPGGFDYEAWMLEKKLYFNASVVQDKRSPVPVLIGQEHGLQIRIDQARDAIRRQIDRVLPDSSVRDVLAALLVGDQRAISREDWAVFQKTGVSHLMSISGLHVTMLAALAGWAGGLCWRVLCRWPFSAGLWIPVQSVAAVCSILGAVGYALLAGFAVPAQRTAWMVVVVSMAKILGVRANPWAVLAVALLVVIVADPMAVLAPGFWLSFLAVAFLFTLPNSQDDRHQWTRTRKMVQALRQAAHAQLAITFGLLPITVLLFQQVVLVGPLANAVAIPVVSYIVTPMSMLGVLESFSLGTDYGLQLASTTQTWLETFLQWCAAQSFAALDWPSPGVVRAAVASAGMVVALGNVLRGRAQKYRHLGWLGLAALFGVAPPAPVYGDMKVSFLDVGQGSSVLVRTQHHAFLYDTGPKTSQSDAGLRVVMPTLRREGITFLDKLMVSHLDQDHSGGLSSLLALVRVGELITSHPEDLAAELAGGGLHDTPPMAGCRAGDAWQWDGVLFQVLHPIDAALSPSAPRRSRKRSTTPSVAPESAPSRRSQRNADSCVIRIQAQHGGSVLLAGDIPLTAERQLVGRFMSLLDPQDTSALPLAGIPLRTQVLLAPHHGSKTSSSEELLRAVDPSLVVVQAGYRNRYGHPHAAVLDRIASRASRASGGEGGAGGEARVAMARTDLQGALQLQWAQGRPQVTDFWAGHQRYWHVARRAVRQAADAEDAALNP